MEYTRPKPNKGGFGESYDPKDEADKAGGDDARHRRAHKPPKSMSDIETALLAGWREAADDNEGLKSRRGRGDQLENKTGMEVAVLALRG